MKCVLFFLSTLFLVSATDVSFILEGTSSKCTEYKNELAVLASNVTLCFIRFSQPLRICEYCLLPLTKFEEKYNELVNKTTNEDDYCGSQLLYSNILSIISDLHSTFQTEWDSVNCLDCYAHNHSFLNPQFTKFLEYEDKVMNCFANYTDSDLNYRNPSFEVNWRGKYFNKTSCTICEALYHDVNNYYDSLEKKPKKNEKKRFYGGICGDMGDMMNMTRFLWSKKFGCSLDKIQWFWAIGPICTVTAMLLVFYCMVSTYFHNKIDMILYKQRRLRPMVEESG